MTLKDETATAELGEKIARALRPGDIVGLSGELGAGKTTLARAILRARGVKGHVPSPTFTLIQAYDTPGLRIHHCDLYRLQKEEELSELGLEEALEEGAVLVEWPERGLPPRLLDDALMVLLIPLGPAAREARLSGPARWRGVFAGTAP